MTHRSWDDVVARLRAHGALTVRQLEVGAGATDDDLEVVKLMGASMPPEPIAGFFRAANGVTLLWDGEIDGQKVQGASIS